MNDRDRAIVVGVCVYPGLQDQHLASPENDAIAFRDWLVDPNGGGLDAEHVKLIVSSDFGDHAPFSVLETCELRKAFPTPEKIESAFEWLDTQAERNSEAGQGRIVGRRLYLYFSGRGFAPALGDAALLMANARPKRLIHNIAGSLWAEWFHSSGYFEEIVLFMDCCRDSYTTVYLRPVTFPPVLQKRGLVNRKRFYAYATKWDRQTWERVMPQNQEVHGVFTTALLEGLRGLAADETGQVSAKSLSEYLSFNMKNYFPSPPDSPVEPDIIDHTTLTDPLIFAQVKVPTFVVRIFHELAIGTEVAIHRGVGPHPLQRQRVVLDQTIGQTGEKYLEFLLPKGVYRVVVDKQENRLFLVEPSKEKDFMRVELS